MVKLLRQSPLNSATSSGITEGTGSEEGQVVSNPYIQVRDITNNRYKDNLTARMQLEWKILTELSLNIAGTYEDNHQKTDVFYPANTEQGFKANGRAIVTNAGIKKLSGEAFLTYTNSWKGGHRLKVLAGSTLETYNNNTVRTETQNFPSLNLGVNGLGMGVTPQIPTSSIVEWNMVSFLARAEYNYKERYLLTASYRADGSSRFGAGNKWAGFPSVGLAWRINEESFVKDLGVFYNLKLRFGYGRSGNTAIPSYRSLSTIASSFYPMYGSDLSYGASIDRPANPSLRWETTDMVNLGLDMSFFKNRLAMTVDVYRKKTTDLLREKYLPLSSSYDKIWVNDGEVTNKGFEVSLEGDIVHTRDWSFSATFIYSMNRNKVVSLGDAISSGLSQDYLTGMYYEVTGEPVSMFNQNASIYAVGHPMNVFYGYRVDGIIQEGQDPGFIDPDGLKDRPGELKYVDLTGDYAITPEDRCIIGDPNPDFTASLNLSLRWKNLDLSVFLYGVYGNDVLYNNYTFSPRVKAKRWTPDNPTNDFPRLNNARQYWLSDYFLQDGSFLRIQNITLGYNLHFNRRFLKGMRIYANIDNVHTFTKFDGYDPEVGLDGIYWGGYPKLRKYTVGIDLNF